MKRIILRTILFAVPYVIRLSAKTNTSFREFLGRHNCVVQIQLKDGSIGRHYSIVDCRVTSKAGIHPDPDVTMVFKNPETALVFMMPPKDQAAILHAAKNFSVQMLGNDTLIVWFGQLMNMPDTMRLKQGTEMPDGCTRFTTHTNGGPLFVYVKDGRIVRTTPIEFDSSDAPSWSIKARGKNFEPMRQSTVAPHGLAMKAQVYSEDRNLYPMKRVDFDPNGERNPQNRGISGYERISWDEALDIVGSEIKRMKKEHGPGAIAIPTPSHHQWGNVGYWLSSLYRFGNLIGFTRVHPNPDSWEGWYWGATHHFGNSLRVGLPGFYGTVEDCLKECDQIVFWSSDPESTNGIYGAFEGTKRRLWAKELGIDFVHIDPHLNPTAQLLGGRWISVRPGTDSAFATAIMHVWVTENLYDEDYVATRTTGFEEWRDYLLGKDDGVPKNPDWQESETGVPAHVVRALARKWGNKKTYLAAGGLGTGLGGACRTATGTQWARSMILMMAMQGWGKPGINFGNLQMGVPLDYNFYFPGYAEGGISGDLNHTATGINNYTRMPHLLSMNPVKQMVTRQRLPDAILKGECEGYWFDGSSMEAQFEPFKYPMKGYSKIHMIYRYGSSTFGTIGESSRFVKSYRHPSIEFVVNQSIFNEGDAKFADIILPVCTSFERADISEWANCGGYVHDNHTQLNHRMMLMQHKCIEPLGESKSDYQIFQEILHRLDLGAIFTEACSELDWCKRVFDSTDLPNKISWKAFLKKGYFVVPPEPEATRDPVSMNWFAEDRKKDSPEPAPLPSQYSGEFGKGVETQSGKIEFVSSSLKRGAKNNADRPALNKYIPSWEGLNTKQLVDRFPLQLMMGHPRYSFHTYGDGKNGPVNDIDEHRVLIDGYPYWTMRINPIDAEKRNIKHHDLIRVFNDRNAVVFVADVSPLLGAGLVKCYESSAIFDPIEGDGPEGYVDRGGCANLLTPSRAQQKGMDGMASNSCLVEFTAWTPPKEAIPFGRKPVAGSAA
jgi:molybdopterin guanine dinucleotide-containing S/N-oxide reductase-like protein